MNPWNSEVTAVYGSLASQPVLTPNYLIFFTPVNLNLKRLKAIDQDNGDYGKVTYSIIQSVRSDTKELFEVEPDSGWVKLKKPLDREKAAEHVLFIRAQDSAQPDPLSGKSM